ncbi:MAG: hypothetical protein MJ151_04120, partial [Lachnospiraceae bacterium]|nr:hypothetical protein [Lachnospiraceae bacterium]
AEKFYAKNYDKWGGGCSCVAKNLDDGRVILGRNMDLDISNKCAYVVRTDCKGKYKTIGLAYTFRDYSPDYEEVKKNGIPEEFGKILPFICDDVMNEKGLYIEVNMRNGEVWPGGQDKFACSGTNPFSKDRVYMFGLPRYIGENCATVEEAVKLAKTLNVYSEDKYWNYCFMMGDAFGNYGLLEFCANEVYWIPRQVGQTNYYINDFASLIQDQKTGLGRLETLKKGIDSVKTKEDMFNLIDSVTYFQVYDPYHCKFDPRSENIGTFYGVTYDLVMNEELKPAIMSILEAYGAPVRKMSRQELRDANAYWESSFTEVVDCQDKTIMVRFFEDDELKYELSFDGFRKVQ